MASIHTLLSCSPAPSPVKSCERTLAIFAELFATEQRAMTISEVSRFLGMPHSSAAALLKSLTQLGYLRVDARGREYYPTLRISLLVCGCASGTPASASSRPC